jgi:hypothetical protein
MSLKAFFSIAENHPVCTDKSCVARKIRVDGKRNPTRISDNACVISYRHVRGF